MIFIMGKCMKILNDVITEILGKLILPEQDWKQSANKFYELYVEINGPKVGFA
jgi:hypothetical protein